MQIQLHFAGGSKAVTKHVLIMPLSLLVMMRRSLPLLLLLLLVFFIGAKFAVASVRATSDDATAAATGYSYSRFVGPVSGPEQRVYVHDAFTGGTRVDYVARPEYQFAYGVEDADARVLHNRHETRDGNAVEGVYSVVDPDGSLRVVKYTADDLNGFRAEVITNGVPILHGGDQYTQTHAHMQQHAPGAYIPQQQQQEYPITAQGQPTLPHENDGDHQQYQVHETPQVQQKKTKKATEDEAEGDEGDYDEASESDNEAEVAEGEDDEEEEGEAYTSYEDGSQEAHSYEVNSDEEDY